VAVVRRVDEVSPSCGMGIRGRHFAMVWWGTTCVLGVYLPPSLSLAQFEAELGEIKEAVRPFPGRSS